MLHQDRCFQRFLGAARPSPCISGPFLSSPPRLSVLPASLPTSPPHFQQQALSLPPQTHSLRPATCILLHSAHLLLRRCPRPVPGSAPHLPENSHQPSSLSDRAISMQMCCCSSCLTEGLSGPHSSQIQYYLISLLLRSPWTHVSLYLPVSLLPFTLGPAPIQLLYPPLHSCH